MCSLFGGILVGIGMAFIFMSGSTTGGTDILGYILQKKKPHISIGKALLMVDGVILLLSIYVFENVEAGLFGLICYTYCLRRGIHRLAERDHEGRKTSRRRNHGGTGETGQRQSMDCTDSDGFPG